MKNNKTRRDVKFIGDAAYIPLTRGKRAIIDAEDFDKIANYCWVVHQSGDQKKPYVKACIGKENGKQLFALLHRFILDLRFSTALVDHINGNPLDNRRANLRICSTRENNFNRRGHGELRYKGVYKNHKRFMAKISVPGSKRGAYIGTYDTPEEAALAYNERAAKLHGKFAVLNKLPPK